MVEGVATLSYTRGWPGPHGQSGGGAFLWNPEAGRLELVGIFHSADTFFATGTQEVRPLGLSALAYERDFREDVTRLIYAPIAQPLAHLEVGED